MRSLVLAAVLALAAPLAFAAEDIKTVFPRPQEVAGWSVTFDVQTYPGDKIYDFIDGAGEIYMQYNFEIAASAEYGTADNAAMAVEVYRMQTPEDAYGVFTYNRPANAQSLDVAQRAYTAGGIGAVWKGNYYAVARVVEDKPGAADAVKDFLKIISGRIPAEGTLRDIFRAMEVEGFKEGTVRFTRTWLPLKNLHFISDDNVLNLGKDTQLAFADFSLKGRDFKTFVAVYPTQEAAEAAAAKYATFLGANRDAEAAWFKQTGRAIVGTWAGVKASETFDSEEMMYATIKNVLEQVRIYQLDK